MKKLMLGAILATCSLAAHAGLTTYQVESYSAPGFSASWLHTATGCQGGPNNNLYMCGDKRWKLSGSLTGDLNGGVLSGIQGTLTAGTHTLDIIGGTLGGAFMWVLETSNYGSFYFENLNMGAGKPNLFDGDEMVLWGQNGAAYWQKYCDYYSPFAYGLDIYATKVPEPSTIALLGLGLIGLMVMRRRV